MMDWKKEKPLFEGEGLTKGLQPIFSTPNLVTQQISFEPWKRTVRHQASPTFLSQGRRSNDGFRPWVSLEFLGNSLNRHHSHNKKG